MRALGKITSQFSRNHQEAADVSFEDRTREPSQADFSRVKKLALDRFATLYGPPKTAEARAYLNEFVRVLKDFAEADLAAGTDLVVESRKYSTWPTPADVRDACNKVIDERRRREAARSSGAARRPNTGKPVQFHILKPHDLQFNYWVDHLREHGESDTAKQVVEAGEFATHERWPRAENGLRDFISPGPFCFEYPKNQEGLTEVYRKIVDDSEHRGYRLGDRIR